MNNTLIIQLQEVSASCTVQLKQSSHKTQIDVLTVQKPITLLILVMQKHFLFICCYAMIITLQECKFSMI